MSEPKFSLTVSLMGDDGAQPAEGEVIPVEDGDVLRFGLRLSLVNGVKRVIYAPRTLVAGLSVNWFYEQSIVLNRMEPADGGELVYTGETDLNVRHEWFVIYKIQPLSISYPGGDQIVAVVQKWKKLGRLGWLSDVIENITLPKLAIHAHLAKREVV